MNKLFISIMAFSAMFMCNGCSMPGTTNTNTETTTQTTAAGSGAQAGGLLANLLTGLLGNNQKISQADLIGIWNYQAPKCLFESENFLMKAGGQVAATQVENKLAETFVKLGIKPGTCSYAFDEAGNYTLTIGARNINGTYTLDTTNNTIKMSALLGLANMTATIRLTGNNLCLLFDADKLLTIISGVSALSNNSTIQSVSSLLNSYDGMKVGFSMLKQ